MSKKPASPQRARRSGALRLVPYRIEETTLTLEEWKEAREAEAIRVRTANPRDAA